jgi:WD40 repeat protein
VVTVLKAHEYVVYSLAVVPVPGGVLVASGGGDKTRRIRLWDPDTGKQRATLVGHNGIVWGLAVSPNGYLISVSSDHSLRVWDVQRSPPECITIIPDPSVKNTVESVLALPDGRVVCGCRDGVLRLWNVTSGANVGEMKGHTDVVTCLVLLHDGRVASSSMDKTIRIWDLPRRSCDAVLKGHTGYVRGLLQLPSGQLASGSNDETIRLWNIGASSGTCMSALLSDSIISSLALLPDGRLVSGHNDGSIRQWSLTAGGGKCDKVIKAHSSYVNALAVLPDGRIASGGQDNTVRITDPDRA